MVFARSSWRSTKPIAQIGLDVGDGADAAVKSGLSVLGILVDPLTYDEAVDRVIQAAVASKPLAVTALAVHGVMTGVSDPAHAYRLNRLDLVLPDGQPVRWALNLRHGAGLRDRCYGPELMTRVCARAADLGLPIALIGSTPEVLRRLGENLLRKFPNVRIALARPSAFRALSEEEEVALARAIHESGARIAFIGLGCPRQEVFVYENRERLSLPTLAVGAAFDFHAGLLRQAPPILQRVGLEWAFRLAMEPKRLWRRYLTLNPLFSALLVLQLLRVDRVDRPREGTAPTHSLRFG
jgi:exopolysaccharide biosynthesis WecB/TagA/CpsF family protein